MHVYRWVLPVICLVLAGFGAWLPTARSESLPTTPSGAGPLGSSTATPQASVQADMSPAASIKAGAERVRLYGCAVCHGYAGNSANPAYPNLAGQDATYLATQLNNFKSGTRKNQLMRGMASVLSPSEMRDVARFFAHQRVVPPSDNGRAESDVAAATLFSSGDGHRGIPACAACHGVDGMGKADVAPRVRGQQVDYLRATLTAWHDGATWGASGQASVMPEIARKLTSADINRLAVYMRNLGHGSADTPR